MPARLCHSGGVNADIEIKEQIECSEDMRHFIS